VSKIDVQFTGVPQFLRALDRAGGSVRVFMSNVAEVLDIEAEKETYHPGKDKGTFAKGNTIKHDVAPGAVPLSARAFTLSPIAIAVDQGRPPGKMPPMKAIRRWAGKHGIPEKRNTGGKVKKPYFYIARAIGARGSKGRQFMAKGLAALQGKMGVMIAAWEQNIKRRYDG